MKRILAVILSVIISVCSSFIVSAEVNNITNTITESSDVLGEKYSQYLEQYTEIQSAKNEVIVDAATFESLSSDGDIKLQEFEGKQNALVWEKEGGYAEYSFNVDDEGLYALKFEYFSIEHKNLSILFSFELDGEYPFKEAEKLTLGKIYNTGGEINQNKNGDDISPKLTQEQSWMTAEAKNETYDDGILVYLSAGSHTVKLSFYQEPVALSKIIFASPVQIPSYEEYAKKYDKVFPKTELLKYEGETANRQSVTLNLLRSDKSSTKTTPYSYTSTRLNVIGGENWNTTGQWLEWDIKTEESGWYNLNLRYSQSYAKGKPSLRRLYINGNVPFKEALNLEFDYSEDWKMFSINDSKGEELPIWLDEGTNQIRLQVVAGEILEIARKTEDIIYKLNNVYRKIIMITGSNPDPYRDYEIEKQVPDLKQTFKSAALELEKTYNYFETLSDNANSASVLKILAEQLNSFLDKPATIVNRISALSGNIGSLSAWVSELKKQPLDVDYILISSVGTEKPKMNENFFQSFWREIKLFLMSFTKDYGSQQNQDVTEIELWLNSGRDQAQVVTRIVEEDFETNSDISVNVKLVTTDLIQAFLSGSSPDAMIHVGRGTPVDLALRGALLDMSEFSDFDEVTKQFMPSATIPYIFNDGCYGLPDSQSFYMMFYRTDIFAELGITVPNTWEEFVSIVEIIQRNNMAIGVPYTGVDASGASSAGIGARNIYSALLLQSDGSFFNKKLSGTALLEENAKQSFRTWTELYSEYGLDLSYDFFNRFRTGEMPIGISLYTTYNQLSIAAPEIAGLWEMVAIPGTLKADGTIDRSQGASGTACVIPSTTKNKEAAWEFVKFWVGAEAQTRYATDIEAVLGVGGRFSPANVEAFKNMPWTTKESDNIMSQWESVEEIHNIPGGYYLIRGLDNAFKDVVYNKEDPYRALAAWDKEINAEIARKREEFHLD